MAGPHKLCFAFILLASPAVAAEPDRYGDPLPPGAAARLGTVRFRLAYSDVAATPQLSPDGKCIAIADSRAVRVWDSATGATVWRTGLIGPPSGFTTRRTEPPWPSATNGGCGC